jgi:hypothetical protein
MMQLSYETFKLLRDLGDWEAYELQWQIWDNENANSRVGAARWECRYHSTNGGELSVEYV